MQKSTPAQKKYTAGCVVVTDISYALIGLLPALGQYPTDNHKSGLGIPTIIVRVDLYLSFCLGGGRGRGRGGCERGKVWE